MFDFFGQILGFVETLFNMVINIVTMLVTLIQGRIGAIEIPLQLAIVAPSILGVSISIFLAVFVAKFIIGR